MALYKTFETMSGEQNNDASDYQIPSINNVDERNQVINQNKIVVIDYYTDWCGPCKTCAPAVAKIAEKYSKPGFCMITKENADQATNTPSQITGVPCFHFYFNGQFIPDATITGAEMDKVEQNIQSFLSSV